MQPVNSSIRMLWSRIITTKKRFDVNSLSSGLKGARKEDTTNELVNDMLRVRKRAPKNTNIYVSNTFQ